MKIATLGDIHANLPALEATLEHAHRQGVEAIWNIGDFVGYGAFPDEVVRLIQAENILSIAGNYDRKTMRFPEKKTKWQASKRPEKFLAFQWAYEHLSEGSRQYLAALPDERRLEAAGRRILLAHGSPASQNEPLTPHTPPERLQELSRMAQVDIVVVGHSHVPFSRLVEETWFINTGSVGRPDDGDPRAAYALLWLEPHSIRVEHFRLEYDIQRAARAIRERGLPEEFAQMVIQGVDLDGVA